MIDIYLDTIRDLSKGKTNKINQRNSSVSANNLVFERDKDIEFEETSSGELRLTNV